MDAPAKLGNNFGTKGFKCAFIRLGDDGESVSTTDVYIGSGTGVPSGPYNLPTGATALYIREDAAGSGSVVYVTHDGGTTWTALTNTAFDPQDTEALTFGTGDDIAIAWDGTRLNITQAAANSEIRWGVSGAGIDQKWYGDTAGRDLTWDQSADSLLFADNTKAVFGDGSDIAIAWNGTLLAVTQAAPNSMIKLGVDGAGIDLVLYGDTANAACMWDQSDHSLILSGVAKLKLQTIAAATGTAIPVTHSGSFPVTTAAAETNTLADPTYLGQTISIFVDTDTSGARVITAASRINQTGNNTITLTEVGDFIKLEAITIAGALKWQVVANDGASLSTV